MKIAIFLLAGLAVYQNWNDIRNVYDPPPDYSAMHEGKVILYSTDWCGYCEKARQLFAKHQIPYFEYDIEKSQEGKSQYRRLGGGGIPVFLINGDVIKGYNESEILKLVKAS